MKHILYLDSVHNYKLVTEILAKDSINFYSFTPQEDKKSIFLLKELNYTFNEEKILTEFQSINIKSLNFLKVSRFTTEKSIQNNRKLLILLVQ